jgi:hypothetical protein
MEQYKKHFKESDFPQFYKPAVKATKELFIQTQAGMGSGNAIADTISMLKEAIPREYWGFISDRGNWK